MDQEILQRARQVLKERNLHGVLTGNPASVAWLSGGYAPSPLSGPNPFEGGPPLLWLDADRLVLLVSDAEQGAAATGAETVAYVSYQAEGPLAPRQLQAESVRGFLHSLSRQGPIGI